MREVIDRVVGDGDPAGMPCNLPLNLLARAIAHEIGSPLAVCASAAQFLMEETVDDVFRRECALKIHNNVKKASAVVEEMVALALPAGDLPKKLVDLVALVRDVVLLMPAPVTKTEIVVRCPDTPIYLRGNENLLRQMILNLCRNAIQGMPEGGLLRLRCGREGGDAWITVQDTGCGISPAVMDRIFDLLFTRSMAVHGTGIGLFLCRSIVKRHGGEITVRSTEGAGSEFTVRLPVG